jgi:nitroreductase
MTNLIHKKERKQLNESIKTLLNRRSIRAYKHEQIKEDELNLLLEAGQYAPTAINEQSWHFTVVQNKELLNKINTVCKAMMQGMGGPMGERAKAVNFSVFYSAPTFIIVSGDEKSIAPQINCSLAMQTMFLAAEAQGLGSCWIHAVTNLSKSEAGKALIKELQIPEGFNIYSAGAFGYKAMEGSAAPRKENTITILK